MGSSRAPRCRSFEIGPVADHVAEALGIPLGTEVARFERLRFAGDEPLALMTNVVPVSVLTVSRRTSPTTASTSCCARPGRCRGWLPR